MEVSTAKKSEFFGRQYVAALLLILLALLGINFAG